MFTAYESEFLTPDGEFVPYMFKEQDNAHGVREYQARFCHVLTCLRDARVAAAVRLPV